MASVNPFKYPKILRPRKHGPEGYGQYRDYKPWLRDEFDFRCVYCLRREQWAFSLGDFQLDHCVAQSKNPELKKDYTNLVLACHNCNHRKSDSDVPLCDQVAYGTCLKVLDSGVVKALNDTGTILIDTLGLDQSRITETRSLYIGTIRSVMQTNKPLFMQWMGFPNDLPDLKNLEHIPPSNNRPEGLDESWFELCKRDQLPAYYE